MVRCAIAHVTQKHAACMPSFDLTSGGDEMTPATAAAIAPMPVDRSQCQATANGFATLTCTWPIAYDAEPTTSTPVMGRCRPTANTPVRGR